MRDERQGAKDAKEETPRNTEKAKGAMRELTLNPPSIDLSSWRSCLAS
jgi:hypothetical protein